MFKALATIASISFASCQTQSPNSFNEDLLRLKVAPTKRYEIKKEALENTDDSDLANASYYYLLGEFLQMEQKPQDAAILFDLANSLDPNEFLAIKALLAKIATGKIKEAHDELKQLVLKYPRVAEFHFIYASFLTKAGHYESAIKQLQEAISWEPKKPKYYIQLITLYQQRGFLEKALKTSKKMRTEIPYSIQGRLIYAQLLDEKGNQKKALEEAKQAHLLDPNIPETTLFYARLLEQNGQSQKAIKLYDKLFSGNPSFEELLSKTVALYQTYGDLSEIYKRLEAMSKVSKQKSLGIEIQKALILWELSKNAEALEVLLALKSIHPRSQQVLYLIGLAYERLDKSEKAVEYYLSVDEESNYFIASNFQILRIYESESKFTEIYTILNTLEKSRYVIHEVFSIGANFYSAEQKYEEAIAYLNKGVQRFPNVIQLKFLIGAFQEKLGQIDKCIQTMIAVVMENPDFSPALNYLGYIWADQGIKLELAQVLIERALTLKPNDGFYLDSLGWVHFKKKEYEKALEYILAASQIESEEAVIWEHLGDIYIALEKFDSALEAYQTALTKQSLEENDKKRILKKLESLSNYESSKA